VVQELLFDDGPAPAAGPPVVAATDGSARPNPGHAAGAWFVSPECWQALAVDGTSTNNVGELVAIRALLEAVPPDRPLHVVYDSTYAQKCVTTWVHSWSRGGRVPPERWLTKEGSPVKNAPLVAAIAALLDGRTVTWSKVKSHTTLTTTEHQLNRAADERAGAVVAALQAGTPPPTGPGGGTARCGDGGPRSSPPALQPTPPQPAPAGRGRAGPSTTHRSADRTRAGSPRTRSRPPRPGRGPPAHGPSRDRRDYRVARSRSSPSTGRTSGMKP
jgi:ribonuclease HI